MQSKSNIKQIIERNEQLNRKQAQYDHDLKFAEYENKILGRDEVTSSEFELDNNVDAKQRNEIEAQRIQFEQEAALRKSDPKRKSAVTSSFDLLLDKIKEISGFQFDEKEIEAIDYETMRRNEAMQIAQEVKNQSVLYYKNYIDKMRIDGHIKNIKYNSVTSDEFNRVAYEQCIVFVHSLVNKLEPIVQIVCGSIGTGKTTLCHVMANEYIELKSQFNAKSVFNPHLPLVMLTTFDEIKKTWLFTSGETLEERNARENRFKSFCEVDLLIIDGLCDDGIALDSFNQRIFSQLLRSRYNNGLPILMTSLYSPSDLLQRIGEVCYECIKEFSKVRAVPLLGESRRKSIDDYTIGEKYQELIQKRYAEKQLDNQISNQEEVNTIKHDSKVNDLNDVKSNHILKGTVKEEYEHAYPSSNYYAQHDSVTNTKQVPLQNMQQGTVANAQQLPLQNMQQGMVVNNQQMPLQNMQQGMVVNNQQMSLQNIQQSTVTNTQQNNGYQATRFNNQKVVNQRNQARYTTSQQSNNQQAYVQQGQMQQRYMSAQQTNMQQQQTIKQQSYDSRNPLNDSRM